MSIMMIVLGIVLLTAGRKLYWLFTAVAGMVAGIYLGGVLFNAEGAGQFWMILIAILGAVVGAILAVALQKMAIALAGFLAGGYGAVYLWQLLNVDIGIVEWVLFVIGGLVGVGLVLGLFEFALIGLTSWAGATLIGQQFNMHGWFGTLVFLGLIFLGVIIQAATMSADKKRQATKEGKSEDKKEE